MSQHDEVLDRMRELFEGWLLKHGEDGRRRALGTLKGQVAALRAARKRKIEWAENILPEIQTARRELYDHENARQAGAPKMVEWLNARRLRTSTDGRFSNGSFDEQLCVDRQIAEDAVLECRTAMSAKALSADFQMQRAEIDPLELACIERIKGGIVLARKLQNMSEIGPDDLSHEAFMLAINVAKGQRDKYLPMIARECYLGEADFHDAVPGIERLTK
ncbi:hypothetical protein WSK_3144 [Novosphingobium sp. Rr 2-17]|uniref:hypothetical protein n=1 Tax=Novosphingobium sp. Rr 2-17 TaxID=555793 RepID=UPI0002698235|nr:hypothetical protein [Novosphingobium sp. Rr 2-17]EIZ78262.1 hypothetical protein WSK_3144 [Novosphingobium sp. Rr 2-17]